MENNSNRNRRFPVLANLIKYKLSLAVAFSAVTGYVICNNKPGFSIILLITGIFLLTAGSAVLNQYTERAQDAIMHRTMKRPIAAKKISPEVSLIIFLLLLLSGSSLLLLTGLVPFILGLTGVFLYNLLYTSLKKITFLAIVPGALVGAVPPLIGYTSAGGTVLDIRLVFFSCFMFLWQIPHFWLLLLRYGKEYQAAGFKTVSDYLNNNQIKILIFIWVSITSFCLILFSILKKLFGNDLLVFLIIFIVLFLILFYWFLFVLKGPQYLRVAFILLNSFSFIIMLFLITDSVLNRI